MLPQWTEDFVTVDDRQFHYIRTGQGNKPALLLLHGFSDNGLCWLPVARDLQDQFDVILPDARGHGLSARLQPNEQIDNAADVAGLITALGLYKPVVGGHSMGGLTATEFGARYPDLASGLFFEDPAWIDPPSEGPPIPKNPFFEWLSNLEGVSLDEIIAYGKATNPAWLEVEFPAWADSKRQLDKNILEVVRVHKSWREFVSALSVPALLVTADVQQGAIVSPEIAEEAASLSPWIEVAPVPNAGHNIRRENYPAFRQALQTFLNQFVNTDPDSLQ